MWFGVHMSLSHAQFQMSAMWIQVEYCANGLLRINLWNWTCGGEVGTWRNQADVSFLCMVSVAEADHWKNQSEEEGLDGPLGFMKHRVPAAQLRGIGIDVRNTSSCLWKPTGVQVVPRGLERRQGLLAFCTFAIRGCPRRWNPRGEECAQWGHLQPRPGKVHLSNSW